MATHAPFTLLILSNSPGEIISWVAPVVSAAHRRYPHWRIEVLLTPCQYASGMEETLVSEMPGVTSVSSPSDTFRRLRSWPWRHRRKEPGAVLFLGGDPIYSRLFALKYGWPVFAYAHSNQYVGMGFRHVFKRSEIGDLMADRVRGFSMSRNDVLKKYGLDDTPYTLFFLGSRPRHFDHYIPLILTSVSKLKSLYPEVRPLFLISPFISEKRLHACQERYPELSQVHCLRGDSLELMSISQSLVTLPGTNNIEAMYMGIPMFIIVPTDQPDKLIFDGLLGLLGRIPILGGWLMCLLVAILKRTVSMVSQPNKRLGRTVVPEYIGNVSDPAFFPHLERFVRDNDYRTSQLPVLANLTPEHSVSDRMVKLIHDLINISHPTKNSTS